MGSKNWKLSLENKYATTTNLPYVKVGRVGEGGGEVVELDLDEVSKEGWGRGRSL